MFWVYSDIFLFVLARIWSILSDKNHQKYYQGELQHYVTRPALFPKQNSALLADYFAKIKGKNFLPRESKLKMAVSSHDVTDVSRRLHFRLHKLIKFSIFSHIFLQTNLAVSKSFLPSLIFSNPKFER
jgi:hypothetical protein